MDIQKGDKIRYSYLVYGTQCIADGVVASVREDGSVTIDRGENELVVERTSILERMPRENELKVVSAPVGKTEEELFNEAHTGISLHKKGQDTAKQQPFSKKINHLGDK